MAFPTCKRSLEISTLNSINLIPYSVDVTVIKDGETRKITYGSEAATQILTHMQADGSYYALIQGNNHASKVVSGKVERVTFAPATDEDYQKMRPKNPLITLTQAEYRSIDRPLNPKLVDLVSLRGE